MILPQMRKAIKESMEAFWNKIVQIQTSEDEDQPDDLKFKIENQFELFGYDFMIDDNMQVYLIEVNTNPCLDTSPSLLL